MAERYQNRSYTTARNARSGDPFESDREQSDPLAELARLIGQTDSFGPAENSGAQVPPRAAEGEYQGYRQDYPQEEEYPQEYEQGYQASPEPEDPPASAGPPQWIQRANLRREAQRQPPRESQREPQREVDNDDALHQVRPAHRYAGQSRQAQPDTYYYQDEPASAEPEPQLDPSRYDDALYGQFEQDLRREPAYPDDPRAYQAGYDEDETEEEDRRRRGPIFLVAGILALAVVGTAAAYGYRTYFGAPRGEPPIIKADNSPTKIIPASSDGSTKLPDRMVSGDGTEKIVPREEQPVDVDTRAAGPRVVFPPPNLNSNTAVVGVPPGVAPQQGEGPAAGPGGEPRKVRTVAVRGDQSDTGVVPVSAPPPASATKSAPAARAKAPVTQQANASANGPLSLAQAQSAPQPGETRVAAAAPTATAPAAGAGSGGYLVQVSSQRNEADAQASFRALQNKFPSVLGSQTPLIKRADLGEKGTYYRAMVGPFATSDEATQFCGNLKSAGGQCIVQKN
jgi:hypothetical protein